MPGYGLITPYGGRLVNVLVSGAEAEKERQAQAEDRLFGATVDGRTDLVLDLIGRGTDVNIRDGNGNTPLHLAA